MNGFETVQEYLTELGYAYDIVSPEEQILTVTDPERAIQNLILDCEDEIIVMEQFICQLKNPDDSSTLRQLLQLNRSIVHGAYTLSAEGDKLIFRDTLQLSSLDLVELKSSIESLGLALAEHTDFLLQVSA